MQGLIFFHQGWTDIINSLPIVSYYSNIYNKLYIIVRSDANNIVNYYFKDCSNVTTMLIPKSELDHKFTQIILGIESSKSKPLDRIIIGCKDTFRNDEYKYRWQKQQEKDNWLRSFYLAYDIPYSERVNSFCLNRNIEQENNIYHNFLLKYGCNYVLYHNDSNLITSEINSIIANDASNTYVNLDKMSDVFYDYIKVIENAKEIHLIDSIWATVIYLIDAKYRLFKHINIYAYCKRNFKEMFTDPVALDNWLVL